jgi:NTE family protein
VADAAGRLGAAPSATTLGDWLAEAPFGLVMSSGFFAFFAHTGVLQALAERGLSPSHVAGSSAGALVTGAFAAGLDPGELAAVLTGLARGDFWDPRPGAGLLAGKKFDAILRRILPVTSFERCRLEARISVYDVLRRRTAVRERGDLVDAIRASCAVPLMFHPVWIEGRPYLDGGILDRPGLSGVPAGRVFFHHIVSRSPWRPPNWPGLLPPRREQLVTLAIDELPRSGPFRLEAGQRALIAAREAARRALDLPVGDSVVRLAARR